MTIENQNQHQKNPFLQLGLVGYPLNKSLSPIIHQTLLGLCKIDGQFDLFPIEPQAFQNTDGFSGLITAKPALAGFNITLPYKVDAYQWVAQRTPQADRIHAVNTIKRLEDGSFIGHNTDGIGFYKALPVSVKTTLHHQNVLVLGAGGACRAVLEALFFAQPSVGVITLVVRNLEKAEPIIALATAWAKTVGSSFSVTTFEALTPSLLASATLVINTTPVGMLPDVEASPLSLAQLQQLPPTCFVSDLVYKPAKTLLLSYAKQCGLPNQNGLGMLIYQGMEAFSFWTNQPLHPSWLSVVEAKILNAFK
jgi:shikimate dehydrogenase